MKIKDFELKESEFYHSWMYKCVLQLNDCHRGVVFDGLETLFAQNQSVAASAILKALNNRRFIFFITLKLDYIRLKEQEKKEQEERGGLSPFSTYKMSAFTICFSIHALKCCY